MARSAIQATNMSCLLLACQDFPNHFKEPMPLFQFFQSHRFFFQTRELKLRTSFFLDEIFWVGRWNKQKSFQRLRTKFFSNGWKSSFLWKRGFETLKHCLTCLYLAWGTFLHFREASCLVSFRYGLWWWCWQAALSARIPPTQVRFQSLGWWKMFTIGEKIGLN